MCFKKTKELLIKKNRDEGSFFFSYVYIYRFYASHVVEYVVEGSTCVSIFLIFYQPSPIISLFCLFFKSFSILNFFNFKKPLLPLLFDIAAL